jgi:hypothetical protein
LGGHPARLILKATALTLIGLVSVGLAVAWLTSYNQNRDLIAANLTCRRRNMPRSPPR